MNVELLRKIAKVIQQKPKEFDMEFLDAKNTPNGPIYDEYGTTHCICGWGEVLTNKKFGYGCSTTQRVFGIGRAKQQRLFFVTAWPVEYRDKYFGYKTRKARAKVAAAYIEHFIKTGGAE